jgi:hypothetical protein
MSDRNHTPPFGQELWKVEKAAHLQLREGGTDNQCAATSCSNVQTRERPSPPGKDEDGRPQQLSCERWSTDRRSPGV